MESRLLNSQPLEPAERGRYSTGHDAALKRDEAIELNQNQDADHLRLLSIFHYIVGGMVGLFSLFPLIHLAVGIAILSGSFDDVDQDSPPPDFIGWMFVLLSTAFITMGLASAICIAIAGRKLKRRTGYLYCLVIAGLECFFMPFGTVLGVLTILVLLRPSVKVLFGMPVESPTTTSG